MRMATCSGSAGDSSPKSRNLKLRTGAAQLRPSLPIKNRVLSRAPSQWLGV
jgi:hypothetical protein